MEVLLNPVGIGSIVNIAPYLTDEEGKQSGTRLASHGPVMPLVGEEIGLAKEYLLGRPPRPNCPGVDFNTRDYTMFCFGINVGLRYGDLFALRIGDVMDGSGQIVESIRVKEEKTSKSSKPPREIFFRQELKGVLHAYISSLGDYKSDWYLFHGLWPNATPYNKLSNQNVNLIMKNIQAGLGLKVELGSHTLRKTFARAIFDRETAKGNNLAIEMLRQLLQHSTVRMTLLYIGLQREEIKNIYLGGEMI